MQWSSWTIRQNGLTYLPLLIKKLKLLPEHLWKLLAAMEYLPAKHLSDRGANFLSDLLREVYVLLGIRKSLFQHTTPKLIWLGCEIIVVETRINESLVLYAYQTCVQESTQESPFYLLYGRDARLPEAALAKPCTCYQMDIDDFKNHLVCNLSFLIILLFLLR